MLQSIVGDIATVVWELSPIVFVLMITVVIGQCVAMVSASERARRAERREIIARYRKTKGEG
jgi:uncharacterized membrane protein